MDNEVRPAADALVLTEWKIVRAETELESKAQEAYDQARMYSSGSLAGFELSSRRYFLKVARKRHLIPCEPHHIRLPRSQAPARACRNSSL
jgi:hypothetical protein